MTKSQTAWVVIAGVLGLVIVGAAVAFALYISGFNDPGMQEPGTPYKIQAQKTLETFDSGQRAKFDALYSHSLSAQRDLVWNACSPISPQRRAVKIGTAEGPPNAAVTISGFSKEDPTKRLTCLLTLDGKGTGGRWDVYLWVPDTAAPSVGPPEKP